MLVDVNFVIINLYVTDKFIGLTPGHQMDLNLLWDQTFSLGGMLQWSFEMVITLNLEI